MNRLILMRHARAESSAPSGGGDRARPLSAVGRADADQMAGALASRQIRPDLAIVSGAVRTRQTWEEMRGHFGDVELELEADLYNSAPDELRRAVEGAESRCACLVLIAHNPGVHQFAVELLVEGAAPPSALDRLQTGFPPGAAAIFAVDAAGRCTFEAFFTPPATGDAA